MLTSWWHCLQTVWCLVSIQYSNISLTLMLGLLMLTVLCFLSLFIFFLQRCWCRIGYKPVDDGLVCVDVDECVDRPDFCSHYCNNTQGSFVCFCSQGYVLEPDGHSCKITGIHTCYEQKFIMQICFFSGCKTDYVWNGMHTEH